MSRMEPGQIDSNSESHSSMKGFLYCFLASCLIGCAADGSRQVAQSRPEKVVAASPVVTAIALASFSPEQQAEQPPKSDSANHTVVGKAPEIVPPVGTALASLESSALQQNSALRRLSQQLEAARAKIGYVDGLPDPTLAANVFVSPIETAAGSQRTNLSVSQMIPWLERLDAKRQRACFEAMALQQQVAAERLRIVADLRELWYRLYFIERQIEISEANQLLIKDLIDVANARVATGKAAQGDVLAGTLEYSRVEEQLVMFRQQRGSTVATLNRVIGRSADVPLSVPEEIEAAVPNYQHAQLRDLAFQRQPLIQSARIRTQATRWGIEVARLQRRPDFSVSASWFEIDSNRPQPNIVDVGQDAWSLGASVSIPLWEKKYNAIENEARWNHAAAHASVADLQQQFDARLLDLWQQAVAANETAELYEDTILPQARDTLEADQQAYSTGTVEFDRVIRDVRNLLTLQVGYHRAVAQLATAGARIEQATGGGQGMAQMKQMSSEAAETR